MWTSIYNSNVTATLSDSTSVAGVRYVYATLSTGRSLWYKVADFKRYYFA